MTQYFFTLMCFWKSSFCFKKGHLISEEGGDNITLSVNAQTKIPLFLRGGTVVPQQQPANNTYFRSVYNYIWKFNDAIFFTLNFINKNLSLCYC